jgi:predicted NBD/HSP70 family sugar kinase
VPAVLGVDLGATNLRVALAEASGLPAADGAPGPPGGEIAARAAEPVPPTGEALAARVAAIARELGGGEPIAAAGVGVPGIPEGDGFAGLIAGAAGLSGAPLRRLLEDALAAPVAIDNDVNLAALAESQARGAEDLAFIAVGTGVGMGIISGGRLIRGAHGAAGELGQLPVGDHVVAPFDELGPLEAIAGGAGLAARAGTPSAREVFEAGPSRLLDDQAAVLASAIRAVQALLDPELIVLGGGIGCRADVTERVQNALAAHGTPPPRLERSRLGEDAGLLGALALARAG